MDIQAQTFRIENKRAEKNIQLFKTLAILTGVLAVFRILTNPDIFSGAGSIFDFGTMILPIVFYFEYHRKAKNWGGQFIEISEDHVSFKTRDSGETVVPINDIIDIEIKLEQIIIRMLDSVEHTIIVEDFTEYEDRMAVKSNFTELKNRISSNKAGT